MHVSKESKINTDESIPLHCIAVLVVMTNIGNIPMLLNVVSYLHGTMHMGIADASTTATNLYGAICVFTLFGAFISDSYINRFYTILIFAPVEILVRDHRS